MVIQEKNKKNITKRMKLKKENKIIKKKKEKKEKSKKEEKISITITLLMKHLSQLQVGYVG